MPLPSSPPPLKSGGREVLTRRRVGEEVEVRHARPVYLADVAVVLIRRIREESVVSFDSVFVNLTPPDELVIYAVRLSQSVEGEAL